MLTTETFAALTGLSLRIDFRLNLDEFRKFELEITNEAKVLTKLKSRAAPFERRGFFITDSEQKIVPTSMIVMKTPVQQPPPRFSQLF